jgi:hypothetical protein
MSPRPEIRVHSCGVVIDSTPAMFPGVAGVGDDIVVSFSTVPDGWPGGEVGIVRSADGGASWSGPVIVARPQGGAQAVLNAVGLTALSDGSLLLPYNSVRWTPGGGVGGRIISLHLLTSRDGGFTWTGGDPIDVDFHGPCVYGGMLSQGGRLLWPVWGQRRAGERWRSSLLESSDQGATWRLGATIGYDRQARMAGSYPMPAVSGLGPGGDPELQLTADPAFRPHSPIDGYSETSVAVCPDGSLLAVLRQQGVHGDNTLQLFRSRSGDGGRTWSPPEPMGFSGMSPLLHRISGGLLLAYRRRIDPERAQPAAVEVRTADGAGTEWSRPIELIDPHGTVCMQEYQCGYPAMIDVGVGRVLALFYSFARERRFIAWNLLEL